MSQPATLVWFRSDLRLEDNPALTSAGAGGGPVAPVFVWSPDEEGAWAPGSASRWWLHQSLEALSGALRRLGSRLIVRQGKSLAVLRELAAEVGATRVVWGRRYEAAVVERDREVEPRIAEVGPGSREPQSRPAVRAGADTDEAGAAVSGLHSILEGVPGDRTAGGATAAAGPAARTPTVAHGAVRAAAQAGAEG